MDILAHSLWGTVGVKRINEDLEKKGKSKVSVVASALWSIFPDIFAFGLPFMISLYTIVFQGKSFSSISHHTPHLSSGDPTFDLASYLYQFSHSIIIFLLIFGVVWFLFKKPQIAMLGWLLHILIDIPSHSLEFFPTPFLFPFSDYVFPYGVRWSTPWFMIVNYSFLLLFFLYYIFRKRKLVINQLVS